MPRGYPKRGRMQVSACPHQGRKHYAKNMCYACYQAEGKRRRPNTSNPEYFRRSYLLRNYGITPEQQDAMFVSQSGKCAICKAQMTPTKPHTGTSLAVDHDHKTGVVRGLLCHFCNIGLGAFKDRPELLDSAKEYLRDKSCL